MQSFIGNGRLFQQDREECLFKHMVRPSPVSVMLALLYQCLVLFPYTPVVTKEVRHRLSYNNILLFN